MKKTLGIIAMGLVFSVPAYAQGKGGGFAATAGGGPNGYPTSTGGGGFGGGIGGGSARANVAPYPRTQFATTAFSGDSSFAPSSFLTFEQAVEVGKAELAPQKSLAQVATENVAAMKAKSRVEFVQDNSGNVVPLHR